MKLISWKVTTSIGIMRRKKAGDFAAALGFSKEERLAFANRCVSLYVETGMSPGIDVVMGYLPQIKGTVTKFLFR